MNVVKKESLHSFYVDILKWPEKSLSCGDSRPPKNNCLVPALNFVIGSKWKFEDEDYHEGTENYIIFEVVEFDSIHHQLKEVEKDINYKK